MVYPIGKIFRHIFTFPVKEIKGLDNLPKDSAFVVASNHHSFIDPLILASILTKPLKAKKIYFISAMLLFFDVLTNFIFSEFGGSIRLKKSIHGGFLKSAMKRLRKGNIVCIFPEGVPNKRSSIRKGKTGVARLVLKSRVPVVPIGIKGTLKVWSRLKWFPRPGKKVIITIGKPIYFKEYYPQDENYHILKKVTKAIMKEIASLIGQKYRF
ncbi:MAG: 1-acyl-sn-glycerol-3-phosphate acyltransferase [Nanoarchaeota archaeon]|nr:1-acyl-sn-glycerol-3-phosphate acyltransferase [Nanoarchaeota archaeon]MBU1004801.1 1-acyl-sn-glycerol-3-phosphate acyltransferase [Nanoarchaeota archaeon]MBU1946481.1 1-acyl-sn-glycerol-3-phosphate acyltransferase [Nanoarchaeota archaeon]